MSENVKPKLLESPRPSLPVNDRNVMYVQRPVKTVVEEDPQRAMSRFLLMICGVVALVTAFVVAIGVIGLRLGFENTLGIPETSVSVLDSGILGIRMIGTIPSVVLDSGNQVLLLPLLGLVAIAFPLAFIAMARPRVPGGPPPGAGVMFLSIVAAVLAGLIGLAAFIWLQIPFRTEPSSAFPLDAIRYSELWRPRVVLISSIDVFAFLASTLWLILLFRLPLVGLGWKYLRIAMIFFVLCTLVGMATTLGLHQGLSCTRPVVKTTGDSVEGLLLGEIGDSMIVMSRGEQPLVKSIPGGTGWSFSGIRSVDAQFGNASR